MFLKIDYRGLVYSSASFKLTCLLALVEQSI